MCQLFTVNESDLHSFCSLCCSCNYSWRECARPWQSLSPGSPGSTPYHSRQAWTTAASQLGSRLSKLTMFLIFFVFNYKMICKIKSITNLLSENVTLYFKAPKTSETRICESQKWFTVHKLLPLHHKPLTQ